VAPVAPTPPTLPATPVAPVAPTPPTYQYHVAPVAPDHRPDQQPSGSLSQQGHLHPPATASRLLSLRIAPKAPSDRARPRPWARWRRCR
jgi:hypothetical protein